MFPSLSRQEDFSVGADWEADDIGVSVFSDRSHVISGGAMWALPPTKVNAKKEPSGIQPNYG